jgi:hydrogenase maturation protein HypF
MLERGVNAPRTTSAGRLFDALASLAGLRQRNSYEGQAASALEHAAAPGREDDATYACAVRRPVSGPAIVDWEPLLQDVLRDLRAGAVPGDVSRRFHAALADAIVDVARDAGETKVVLSGGCFQNALLLTETVIRLRAAGFAPYWHQRVPPNDGGLALGQAIVARRTAARGVADVSRGTGAGAER